MWSNSQTHKNIISNCNQSTNWVLLIKVRFQLTRINQRSNPSTIQIALETVDLKTGWRLNWITSPVGQRAAINLV